VYLLGIDVGTTGCKTMLFDLEGRVIAFADQEYPTYYPQVSWAEQEPKDWWEAVKATVRCCLAKAEPGEILGIGVSSHREAVVPLSENGEVLARSIIWMDKRSLPQTEWIRRNFNEDEIYRRTGLRVDPTFTATKLLWLKEHQPELLERTSVLLQPKDYIVYRLTGGWITDQSIASRTLLYNIRERRWDERLFEMFGLRRELFPEALPSDEVVGRVTEEAAAETGLAAGTPVVAGGGDRTCEALGAGAINPSILEESTGSATTMATTLDEPFFDPQMRIACGCHVIPGKWCLEAGIGVTGAVFRWCRDKIFLLEKETAIPMRRRAYELMDMQSEYIPPGSGGLLVIPHFMGSKAPKWNPKARGVILGLTLLHSRVHIAKAVMEGVAYEIRFLLETLEELGIKPEEIRLQGGASKSPVWSQIKADVWGRPVTMLEVTDGACLGDAILAGVGVGAFANYNEAVSGMVRVRRVIEPDDQAHHIYDRLYEIYCEVASSLDPYFAKLQEVTLTEKIKELAWERKMHLLDYI